MLYIPVVIYIPAMAFGHGRYTTFLLEKICPVNYYLLFLLSSRYLGSAILVQRPYLALLMTKNIFHSHTIFIKKFSLFIFYSVISWLLSYAPRPYHLCYSISFGIHLLIVNLCISLLILLNVFPFIHKNLTCIFFTITS